ncbi:MAG: hypothetical protein OEW83_17250 [Acidimicrobiia bacterium]|nr:hypothetical protein [Acidimicrobiia bacterium]
MADAVARLREAGKLVGALVGHPRHVERYLDISSTSWYGQRPRRPLRCLCRISMRWSAT